MLEGFDEVRKTTAREGDEFARLRMQGHIAVADRQYDEAVRFYRESDQWGCTTCILPELGRAYDLAGNADSALAVFTRYVENRNDSQRPGTDSRYLAGSYKRLGELWEQKGDKQKALGYYLKFVDLWKNADPELQPKVSEVRQRIARLKDVETR